MALAVSFKGVFWPKIKFATGRGRPNIYSLDLRELVKTK